MVAHYVKGPLGVCTILSIRLETALPDEERRWSRPSFRAREPHKKVLDESASRNVSGFVSCS